MSERAAGSIYDLGYRHYEGERRGRTYAVRSLYLESLRGAFGLGRKTSSKFFPMGLTAVAAFPAVIQVVISTLSSEIIEVISADEYFQFIEVILALFCAAVAPELVGRDLRTRTLALYFSHALTRGDYVLAKLAAMATAMLVVTLGPQTLLFVGNGLAGNDLPGYARDEWDLIPPIVATAVLASILVGSIGVAIAAQTPRRMYATVGILVPLLLVALIAQIIYENFDSPFAWVAIYLSPIHLMEGFTSWLFGETPEFAEIITTTEPPRFLYALAAMAIASIAAGVMLRRYRRLDP